MIDAKELRVGNWVKVAHGYVQIEKFVGGGMHFTDGCGSNYNHPEPIEVTSDILESAGFDIVEDSIWPTMRKKHFVIDFGTDYLKIFIEYYHSTSLNLNIEKKLFSFHRLQNIIFDLTGEELTLNK